MQQQLLDLLLKEEELSWKQVLYDLVKSEQMDPWDIDITLITRKYIEAIAKMKEHDIKISGKVLLAAAVMLKIKSTHLVDNDIANLDRLIHQQDESILDEEYLQTLDPLERQKIRDELRKFKLIPKNPQPRSRKVSIHDLVDALQKAMLVKKRALEKQRPVKFHLPKRGIDIIELTRDVYLKIIYYAQKVDKLSFSHLLPQKAGKSEKVYTFIPLLHLENQQKITTVQEKAFSEIYITPVQDA